MVRGNNAKNLMELIVANRNISILILVLLIGVPLTKPPPLKPLNLIYAQPKIMKAPQPIILSPLKPPSTGLKAF